MTEQRDPSGQRKGRRAHLNDFHQTVSGEYVYTGRQFAFQGSPDERKQLLGRLTALAIGMTAAAVAAGCIVAPGMLNCFYVILPYTAALICVLTLDWGLARLIHGGDPLRQYVHDASVKVFPLRAGCAMGFSLLAFVCECLYVLLNGTGGQAAGFALFLLLQGLTFTSALLWRRLTARVQWEARGGSVA